LRKDMSNGQAPSPTSTTPAEDSENLQDMWDEPLEVAMDTWAVTRCLNDHGKKETRWSAGHFVAVAMWSGGLEAGIQAAKAIRIFGLWSPHADDEDEALPPGVTRRGESGYWKSSGLLFRPIRRYCYNGQDDAILVLDSLTSRQLTFISCANVSDQISHNSLQWCGRSWSMVMVLLSLGNVWSPSNSFGRRWRLCCVNTLILR
jgi:hypothetical protein